MEMCLCVSVCSMGCAALSVHKSCTHTPMQPCRHASIHSGACLLCAHVCLYVKLSTYAGKHVSMHVFACVCVCACMHLCNYVCVHKNLYTYICIRIYVYTYIYISCAKRVSVCVCVSTVSNLRVRWTHGESRFGNPDTPIELPNYLFASCLGRVLAGMAAQNALAQRFEVALQAIGKLQASYRVLAGISMWKQVLHGSGLKYATVHHLLSHHIRPCGLCTISTELRLVSQYSFCFSTATSKRYNRLRHGAFKNPAYKGTRTTQLRIYTKYKLPAACQAR